MSTKQRKEYKAANQRRKKRILAYADPRTGKRTMGHWVGGVIQGNG